MSGRERDRAGRRHRLGRRGRLVGRSLGALVVLLVLTLVADAVLLAQRVDRLEIRLTSGPGETWVLVGLDSGLDLATGTDPGPLVDPEDLGDARADIVIVVHRRPDGRTTALSLPRDLVVVTRDGRPRRLALAFRGGGQDLVDGLCRTLGIATDHLVTLGFGGFQAVVESLGGIDVEIPAPVRDAYSGLYLPRAGRQHLDAPTTLALVRSRHPETLVDGTWTPEPEGSVARTRWAALALAALADRARAVVRDPLAAQRLAWTVTGALDTDEDTSLWDLLRLGRTVTTVRALPATVVGETAVQPDARTRATLADAGLTGCDFA